MCFKTKPWSRPKKATEDIEVFKALSRWGDTLESPYFNKRWKIGEVKKSQLVKRVGKSGEIHKGLHSGKTQDDVRVHTRNIYPAVIPKGSMYYENDREYVSNKLIIVRKHGERKQKTRLSKLSGHSKTH